MAFRKEKLGVLGVEDTQYVEAIKEMVAREQKAMRQREMTNGAQ